MFQALVMHHILEVAKAIQEIKTPIMFIKIPTTLLSCILFFSMSWCIWAEAQTQIYETERFLQCLYSNNIDNSISTVIYTPKNSSYKSTLQSSIQNQRFASPVESKPFVIITPLHYVHIQSAVSCAKTHRMQIRIRGGGHDFEGLSYISHYDSPFVLVDMRNLISISIDTTTRTAWVEGGARLGELYHSIAEKSPNLGFPAGICPSVGVGGHFSGGGQGTLSRKYGLAADNIIDAIIVDANGAILDRKSMGEDIFWAIRGGGGASFGIILAYKINLVSVPSTVTVFTVTKTLTQNATKLVHLWQQIAPKVDRNLFLRIVITQTSQNGKVAVQVAFNSLFLGRADKLLSVMQKSFPELGLKKEDCKELRWIEAALYFSGLPDGSTVNDLVRREPFPKSYYKIKSDFVVEPISEIALEGLWRRLKEEEAETAVLTFTPYGGRMNQISESEIPFPHRAGNLYNIEYLVVWNEKDNAKSQRYIDWIRKIYKYMAPSVSKSPRAVYYNFRDLDLGANKEDKTSYAQASAWGFKYFKNNFNRLARVKKLADPTNFFRYEQSIPPFGSL